MGKTRHIIWPDIVLNSWFNRVCNRRFIGKVRQVMYLLTYDRPHRKTQDLAFRLTCMGIKFTLAVTPWVDRKNHKPLYPTKPVAIQGIQPRDLGVDVIEFGDIKDGSIVIIGGAGILPESFTKANTVINSHCGWLPKVRGLDSLKWAICFSDPIGCTTHVIDGDTDSGLLIERRVVELFTTDSLFSIAMRQYELELDMLIDCVVHRKWESAGEYGEPGNNPTRRMDHLTELVMIERLKNRLVNLQQSGTGG